MLTRLCWLFHYPWHIYITITTLQVNCLIQLDIMVKVWKVFPWIIQVGWTYSRSKYDDNTATSVEMHRNIESQQMLVWMGNRHNEQFFFAFDCKSIKNLSIINCSGVKSAVSISIDQLKSLANFMFVNRGWYRIGENIFIFWTNWFTKLFFINFQCSQQLWESKVIYMNQSRSGLLDILASLSNSPTWNESVINWFSFSFLKLQSD